jgi:hypothetical protein
MQNFKKDQQIPLVQVTDPNTGQTYYAPQNVVYDEKNNNGPQYLRNVIVDQATTASYFSGSVSNAVNATSASYAATASYIVGGIGSPGGPNTSIQFNKNGNFSGSTNFTFNSALNSLTLTGSLNVTGSTLQTGNNTLIGNTTLSGSIIISGSNSNPVQPTFKIYGDMETNGVIKFLPVVKSVDPAISASYIYVSGSTNDLYFSQNGAGYTNNTRLRWIEGNLYTGLLSGGILSSTPGSKTFNLSSGSGIIVTLNATTSSADPFPTIQYLNWGNFTNQPLVYSGSARLTYVSVNSAGAIDQSPNPVGYTDPTQWDNQIEIGVILHLSGAVSTGAYNAPQVAYGLAQRTDDFVRAFGPLKISGHILQPSGSTLGLIKTSGNAYNNGANYVVNPNHPSTTTDSATSVSKIYLYYVSGSTPIIDTGVANAGYTFIDPSKYNNNGTLSSVPGGQYTIQRVFWIPNSPTNAFLVYYGNATYNSADTAQLAIPIEPFTEAPNTAQNAILLGYVIANGSETNLQNALIVQSGLFRSINGVGSSGTTPTINTFAGLADVSIASRTAGDLSYYNGSLWINSKILSGSYGISGSLNVSQGITGSLLGTSSFASTASFVQTAQTASYVLTAQTASYVLNAVSASRATTSSFAITSSYILNAVSASFASTASFVTNLNQTVTLGNITSTPSNENTLNIYPPIPTAGTGEGGQLMLAASGGLYTSASMIDNYQNYLRILRGTNTGGSNAQLIGLDLQTGNLSVAGAVTPGVWTAGQVINDIILSNTEVTISTTTIATSTTDTNFLTYSYTPLSSTSYLIIHYHLGDYTFESGTGNDSYFSRIKVDDAEITYANQSTVNGFRTGVLFPLLGRYRNSNTTAKSIVVAARRDSADDSITITNTSTSMWLRITEVAR